MSEYEKFVSSTMLCSEVDYLLAGLCEEVGEVMRLRRKELYNTNITREQYLDELGDVLWYLTAIIQRLDSDIYTVSQLNITKLQEKFSDQK